MGRQRGRAIDSRFLGAYQDWQDWARRYVRTLGAARFASSIVSDTCSRCELLIEERDGQGDWGETNEGRLTGVMDAYRNEHLGQGPKDLVRAHSHHYQVAGEMVQVTVDGDAGIDYRIYSIRACDFNKPKHGDVTIRDVPNGTVRAGTAYIVPASQVVRFWMPDEEWPGLATSPMAAGMEDLHRYAAIVRYMRREAESKLALGKKLMWTPGEAHDDKRAPDDRLSRVQRDYLDMAKIGLDDDSDIRAAVPPELHWKKEWGPPQMVDLTTPFDKDLLAGGQAALEDFARGINLPSSVVTSGGSANQNHWNEWLIDERFFDSGIAWVMNAITHRDVTRTFLWPLLRMVGLPRDRFRVGYDPTPVIIRPDRSQKAIELNKAGLLADFPTLEANGFDPEEAMQEKDLNRLLQVLSAGRVQPGGGPPEQITVREQIDTGPGGTPVDPSSVDKAPPTRPVAPKDLTQPMASSITASAARRQNLTDRVRIANRVLKRVQKIRRDTAAKLHARAQQAYSDAVDQAARTAANKVRHRRDQRKISADLARRALDALQAGRDAGPLLAAVGMTEGELLDSRFQGFQADAAALLRRANEQQQQAIADAGLSDRLYAGDDQSADAGGAFLAAGALALARSRLTTGDAVTPTLGEISGTIPASLAVDAVGIGSGERRAIFGETPDDRPTTADGEGSLIDALSSDLAGEGDQLALQIEYTWVYGANGEPDRPYEPHVENDGEVSTDPENEWLAVDDFTDFDYLWPQDHDGCSCAVDQQFVEPDTGGGEAGVGYGGMPEGQPGE